jgi:mannose-6-phosphate isomerase
MKPTHLYPYLLTPAYKDYIWGGTRIPEIYHRAGTPTPCAESWEVSDRSEGESIVQNGPCQGVKLSDLIKDLGPALVGPHHTEGPFPLLIKLIDAKQHLSVQVHPDDATAPLFDAEAKSEMWVVLDATPGAKIYAGLKPGTTKELFLEALDQARLETVLQAVPAIPGQTIFVPGGKVHAIGAGCLLLEVQQNSNTTYRIDDWGRVGADGNPRETHREQALGVIDWQHIAPEVVPPGAPLSLENGTMRDLLRCPLFTTRQLELTGPEVIENDGDSFLVCFCETGGATLTAGEVTVELTAGATCLLPAALDSCTIAPRGQSARLILINK